MSTEANGPPAAMPTQELAEYLTTLESERDMLKAQSALCGSELRQLRAQLSLCRDVLEECRPMVKARLCEMADHTFKDVDDSILTRIEAALAGAPVPDELATALRERDESRRTVERLRVALLKQVHEPEGELCWCHTPVCTHQPACKAAREALSATPSAAAPTNSNASSNREPLTMPARPATLGASWCR